MTTPRFLLTSSFVMMLCWPAGGSVAAKSPVFPGNCGARCLYVIALSRGCQLPTYDQFVEQHDWAAAPSCSLHQIHVSAKELGLEGTLLKFEGAPPDLKHRLLVAHTTDEHFVILQKVDEERAWACVGSIPLKHRGRASRETLNDLTVTPSASNRWKLIRSVGRIMSSRWRDC